MMFVKSIMQLFRQAAAAQIITSPLQQGTVDLSLYHFTQKAQVTLIKLILQYPGKRAHYYWLSSSLCLQVSRCQVTQPFSYTCACFHDGKAIFLHCLSCHLCQPSLRCATLSTMLLIRFKQLLYGLRCGTSTLCFIWWGEQRRSA